MFDPSLPAANSPNSSAQMRGQLTSLKSLIDAVQNIAAAQVDGVTTGNPGDPASVIASIIGSTLHFTFAIPRGQEGLPGQNGQDGGTGAQGPPFAQAIVDAVNTLNPGEAATVSVSFDGTNVHFTFNLPRGDNGTQGIPGTDGLPGEVTNAALAAAIGGTSSSTNAVTTLDTAFANDPPILADLEVLRAKLNEFILAARRV